MLKRLKILFALILILVGTALLTGCLYVPAFNATIEGQNAAKKVGDAKSNRPIRKGVATRSQVESLMGTPYFVSNDGRSVVYVWMVRNGWAIWPLCFYADELRGYRSLVLRFDENGTLRSSEVLALDSELINWSGTGGYPLPQDLTEERSTQSNAEFLRQKRLSTMPSTIPQILP